MTRVGVRGPLSLHLAAHRRAWQDGFTVVPIGPAGAVVADVMVEGFPALDALDVKPADDGVHCVVATSGTTGRPRQIEITRKQLIHHRAAAIERLGCGPESVWAAGVHPWRIGGIALIDRCLHGGGTLAVDKHADSDGVTHASVVPTALYRWVEAETRAPDTLQCLLVGGDRLPDAVAAKARELGWPVYATYGLTEACSQVATATPDELAANPGTVGRPLDGVQVSIVDGEVHVDGPTVTEPLATGDLGHMDGGRLYITGRTVDRIISGGVNVDPYAVERALSGCPGIDEVAVVGQADEEWGQIVEAYVVGTADLETVQNWSKERLEPAAVPKGVIHLPALPRNDQGKVVRNRLRHPTVPE